MPRDIEMGLDAGSSLSHQTIKIKEFMDTLNTALEFAEEELAGANEAGGMYVGSFAFPLEPGLEHPLLLDR